MWGGGASGVPSAGGAQTQLRDCPVCLLEHVWGQARMHHRWPVRSLDLKVVAQLGDPETSRVGVCWRALGSALAAPWLRELRY